MTTSKKHTKILYLTLRSGWGGAPMHIDLIIRNLNKSYNIFIAAPIEEPYGSQWIKIIGEENYFELPHRKFSFLKLLKLSRFIKNNKIKIVHAHGKGAGLYARLLKLLFIPKIKIIFTLHGFHINEYSPLQKKIYLAYEKFFSHITNYFINVSEGERNICLSYKIFQEPKSKVIYNAIPFQKSYADKNTLRKKLNLPQNKFIILSLVRFSSVKNLEATLNIADLFKSENKYLFIIVGDGEEKEKIEKEVKLKKLNNVLLTGYRNNPHDYIIASDIYLSTSRWEGLPYSLIEACMYGLPAVVTDVIGNNEVIINNFNGKLFDQNDFGTAAAQIKEILENEDLYNFFSVNAKKQFEENFSLDKMLSKIEQVYRGII